LTVVYADTVFVLNAIADYFLLLVTARLSGIALNRRRYFIAAFVGGAYALAVFLPGGVFLSAPAVKIVMGILLAVIAYGNERNLFRLTILLFIVSCGFAGAVLGLSLLLGEIPVVNGVFYTDINTRILAAAFAAGYLLVIVVFRAVAHHRIQAELLPVIIWIQGKKAELYALRDTGNDLRDAVSGQSVLVVGLRKLNTILPGNTAEFMQEKYLRKPDEILERFRSKAPELRPQLMPYRTIGSSNGILLTIRVDLAEIGGISYPGLRFALAPLELENEYGALWGGEVRGERMEDGIFEKTMGTTSKVGKSAAAGRSLLYRRQRNAAASSDKRT